MTTGSGKKKCCGKCIKVCLPLLLVALVAIQFVPVERTNPAVSMEVDAPADVVAVLKQSCYDCHSNETTWPWYSKVAPVSWLVAHDVEEGREHVNFSEWDTYSAEDRRKIAEEAYEEAEEGKMPIWFYVMLHGDAKLSDSDLASLKAWAGE
ncbi:MAG: heme-binding protein [Planctomycetes bacterium]|nr:heme-binding protein [Planctomycetota bacterium]NOG54609.1 heme-binding domain-containing protein [Planctomycetota bacterium]